MSTHTRTQLTGGKSYLHVSLFLSLSLSLHSLLFFISLCLFNFSHSFFHSASISVHFLVDDVHPKAGTQLISPRLSFSSLSLSTVL